MVKIKNYENYIKSLILNYNAHLSQNVQSMTNNNYKAKFTQNQRDKIKLYADKPYINFGYNSGLYTADYQVKNLANLLFIVNKLLYNKAKILVINGIDTKFKINLVKLFDGKKKSGSSQKKITAEVGTTRSQRSHKLMDCNSGPYILQSGWINGSTTNWSRLCKVAWNSQRLAELARTVDKNMHLESWILEAESFFKGTRLDNQNDSAFKLAYKHKADCIVLINPKITCLRECEKLNIPLCIVSTSSASRVTGSHFESNRESCFLTYFILCVLYGLT